MLNMTFYDKFNPEQYMIKDFKHWVILLRTKQKTLGAAVIVLKRKVDSIGDASGKELAEFPAVIKWYESKCKEGFNSEKFNYLAAMMKDNFVHFHAFPRYSKPITFAGIEWNDEDWPRPVNVASQETDRVVLKTILETFTK